MKFEKGMRARYRNDEGIISFVDSQCITLCVRVFPGQRVRNVCIVIPNFNFDEVELLD